MEWLARLEALPHRARRTVYRIVDRRVSVETAGGAHEEDTTGRGEAETLGGVGVLDHGPRGLDPCHEGVESCHVVEGDVGGDDLQPRYVRGQHLGLGPEDVGYADFAVLGDGEGEDEAGLYHGEARECRGQLGRLVTGVARGPRLLRDDLEPLPGRTP